MDVVVTGIGLISALGNLNATWNRLLQAKSGIQIYQLGEIEPLPLALIGNAPTTLESLIHQVIVAALEDAQLTPPLPECGVVVGSSRGNQLQWEKLAKERGKEVRGQEPGVRKQGKRRRGRRGPNTA